jgi:chromosome partitioning protein
VISVPTQYGILDLPPHIAEVTEAAAGIADLALIPVRASLPDLDATRPTLELVRDARSIRADKGPRALLVPSAVDRRTAAGREIGEALLDLGETVAPSIGQRTAYADAWAAGMAVADWLPGSPAAAEIAALVDVIEEMPAE